MEGKLISLIVPVFNEEDVMRQSYERMKKCLEDTGYSYEILYVNDGSRDGTLKQLRKIAASDDTVRVYSFSRNFGHQLAVTCGMDHAQGDALIIIDADLQDPPELFADLIAKWEEGADIVYGQRLERQGETFMKKFTAAVYYRLLNALSAYPIPLDAGDFRLLDRKVADVFLKMREHDRYLRGMSAWMGFETVPLPYERKERAAGTTKYTLKKMLKLAFDGITGFSDKLLLFPLYLGIGMFVLTAICLIALIACAASVGVAPWLWGFEAILLLFSSLFTCVGLQGMYLGRMYGEVKNRPLYIVAEVIGDEKENK